MEQLNISWRDLQPITMNNQLKLPDMQITAVEASYCDGTYLYGMLISNLIKFLSLIFIHADFLQAIGVAFAVCSPYAGNECTTFCKITCPRC